MGRRLPAAAAMALATAVVSAGTAWAHIERTAYWPDPRPDDAVSPAAGGAVPKVRSLASALDDGARGTTRVVCESRSLSFAERDIASARDRGWRIRPSQ